jgi:hypothetical protein
LAKIAEVGAMAATTTSKEVKMKAGVDGDDNSIFSHTDNKAKPAAAVPKKKTTVALSKEKGQQRIQRLLQLLL